MWMNNEFRKLEDKHRARFPAYLCQLESFLSGRHLSKLLRMVAGGSEAQNGLLRQRLAEPSTTESEQLLICELVAASIGQGLSSPGWNISIEGWLYESQFQSDSRLCLAASSYLRDLCNTIRDQENKVGEIKSLVNRLNPNLSQTAKYRCPYFSKKAYKETEAGFDGITNSFGLVDHSIVFRNPMYQRSLEATALKPNFVNGIHGFLSLRPTVEEFECSTILLTQFRTTIEKLKLDACSDIDSTTGEEPLPSLRGLMPSILEITNLANLQTSNFIVSPDEAMSLLELPLWLFRVSTSHPELSIWTEYDEELISRALAKESLLVLDVPYLNEQLISLVQQSPSRPLLQVNGRMVAERSEGRGE